MLHRIRRGFAQRLPVAVLAVIATVVGSFVLVNVILEVKLGSADRVELSLAGNPSGGGSNYLLIGSDTRSFVDNEGDAEAFGEESDTGPARSDTIMVLHTDPSSERALLVSFPRDLWVDIPGLGGAKLNAAFNDGPQSVIDTLGADFDVPIQHYIEVNFDSFRTIVDAIGSVPVYFPAPARDELSNLTVVAAGCFELDGPSALSFVRSRHLEVLDPASGEWTSPDPIPDLGRIARQQAFLREVGKRAMDKALTNPFKANDIIDGAISRLRIDGDFGRTDVFNVADALAAGGSGPETLTVPTKPATRDGQAVLDATSDAEALFARLRDFETVAPTADAGDASPEDTSVQVLNASGVGGAAAEALAALEELGFQGVGSGNASRSRTTSEVHYQPGDEDKAALVAKFVSGSVTLVEDQAIADSDVLLVIGDSFGGINRPAAPAPPPDDPEAPPPQPASLSPVPGAC